MQDILVYKFWSLSILSVVLLRLITLYSVCVKEEILSIQFIVLEQSADVLWYYSVVIVVVVDTTHFAWGLRRGWSLKDDWVLDLSFTKVILSRFGSNALRLQRGGWAWLSLKSFVMRAKNQSGVKNNGKEDMI